MPPKMVTCPSCQKETVAGWLSDEGQCTHCEAWWHLEIDMVPQIRCGKLVRQIDPKDAAARAKAFVPQGAG